MLRLKLIHVSKRGPWCWGNNEIAQMSVKQPWWIWINESYESAWKYNAAQTKTKHNRTLHNLWGIHCIITLNFNFMSKAEKITFCRLHFDTKFKPNSANATVSDEVTGGHFELWCLISKMCFMVIEIYIYIPLWQGHVIRHVINQGGGTKALFITCSFGDIFAFVKEHVRSAESRSYLACVTAAELQQYLWSMKVILYTVRMFW